MDRQEYKHLTAEDWEILNRLADTIRKLSPSGREELRDAALMLLMMREENFSKEGDS